MFLQPLFLAITFAVAALPFGVVFATWFGEVDIRREGSGNIGASNAWRVYGRRVGLMTFAADTLKGLVPIWLAPQVLVDVSPAFLSAVALAAFLGHCYTPLLAFRGGKGVATCFGCYLALSPWAAVAAATVWLILVKLTRTSSAGALGGITALLLAVALIPGYVDFLPITALLALGILHRHRGNIASLRRGAEQRF